MGRIILHCDLNNFFASATLSKNPTVKNLPVAVCGDAEKRHGIILAKNTIAKEYGVKTAETIWEAKRKCPELVLLKPDYALYESLSKKVQLLYLEYSDLVEPFGIDECWVEITNPGVDFTEGERVANELRQRVKQKLGLTISVGVSYTKTLAKLGSDLKKPDAVTVITPAVLKQRVWQLPCSELLMVGRSTAASLHAMGIFTVGDLAHADDTALKKRLGKNGYALKQMALGEENSPVRPYHLHEKPKSIGHSATAERDLTTEEEVFAAFLEFSENISRRLREEGLLAGTVVAHITTFDFETKEFRAPLSQPTDLSMVIAKAALALFQQNYHFEKPLRAVGVRAVNLVEQDSAVCQMNLFEDIEGQKSLEQIEKNMLEIREKYGKDALKRAICMENPARSSSPGFYKKR